MKAVGIARLRLVVAAMVGASVLAPAATARAAAPQGPLISEFAVPGTPNGIATGADGNLWFTDPSNSSVDRFRPDGTVTAYPVGMNVNPGEITSGSDGNIWFLEHNVQGTAPPIAYMGRITTAGVATQYPTGSGGFLPGMTLGADGNLWFVEGSANQIGRMTPTGTLTEFSMPTSNAGVAGLAMGADGNVWFTEAGANQLGVISQTGVIREYPIPTANSNPRGPTLGPDGHLWFPEYAGNLARASGPGRSTSNVPAITGRVLPAVERSTPP